MNREEFINKVKEGFLARMSAWDSESTQDFINGAEAEDIIAHEYTYNVECCKDKGALLSDESFWSSAISSTIQCLALLL